MSKDESEDDRTLKIISDYLHRDPKQMQAVRDSIRAIRNEELQRVLEAGPEVASAIPCMRHGCPEMRWAVPTSSSVLCREHTMEVFRGERRAPPIRRNIDYIATSRKTFLVSQLPTEDKDT